MGISGPLTNQGTNTFAPTQSIASTSSASPDWSASRTSFPAVGPDSSGPHPQSCPLAQSAKAPHLPGLSVLHQWLYQLRRAGSETDQEFICSMRSKTNNKKATSQVDKGMPGIWLVRLPCLKVFDALSMAVIASSPSSIATARTMALLLRFVDAETRSLEHNGFWHPAIGIPKPFRDVMGSSMPLLSGAHPLFTIGDLFAQKLYYACFFFLLRDTINDRQNMFGCAWPLLTMRHRTPVLSVLVHVTSLSQTPISLWATFFTSLPPAHPLGPLALQQFFSLLFMRLRRPPYGGSMAQLSDATNQNMWFGHLFFEVASCLWIRLP